jgi:hypothetical protein
MLPRGQLKKALRRESGARAKNTQPALEGTEQ